LSTIHGIVKQHEGWIDVSSEIGRGSEFRIYFPAVNGRPDGGRNGFELPRLADVGNGETVLVVEDEVSVRDLASSALQKRGYQVVKAANGPEAITLWERSTQAVHLLLTEMVMTCGM